MTSIEDKYSFALKTIDDLLMEVITANMLIKELCEHEGAEGFSKSTYDSLEAYYKKDFERVRTILYTKELTKNENN